MSSNTHRNLAPHVGPLYVSSRNCDAAVGVPWRAAYELAERHGCEIISLGPKKRLINAADLQRALRAEADKHAAAQAPLTEEQEAAELLKSMGLEVKQ